MSEEWDEDWSTDDVRDGHRTCLEGSRGHLNGNCLSVGGVLMMTGNGFFSLAKRPMRFVRVFVSSAVCVQMQSMLD